MPHRASSHRKHEYSFQRFCSTKNIASTQEITSTVFVGFLDLYHGCLTAGSFKPLTSSTWQFRPSVLCNCATFVFLFFTSSLETMRECSSTRTSNNEVLTCSRTRTTPAIISFPTSFARSYPHSKSDTNSHWFLNSIGIHDLADVSTVTCPPRYRVMSTFHRSGSFGLSAALAYFLPEFATIQRIIVLRGPSQHQIIRCYRLFWL